MRIIITGERAKAAKWLRAMADRIDNPASVAERREDEAESSLYHCTCPACTVRAMLARGANPKNVVKSVWMAQRHVDRVEHWYAKHPVVLRSVTITHKGIHMSQISVPVGTPQLLSLQGWDGPNGTGNKVPIPSGLAIQWGDSGNQTTLAASSDGLSATVTALAQPTNTQPDEITCEVGTIAATPVTVVASGVLQSVTIVPAGAAPTTVGAATPAQAQVLAVKGTAAATPAQAKSS